MAKAIPIDLNPTRAIEIDGGLVAHGLGLALPEFQQLMEHRKITVLCERGVGEHAGLYRATFYHEGKRVRLVVNGDGMPVEPPGA
jgi:hypothetical protein